MYKFLLKRLPNVIKIGLQLILMHYKLARLAAKNFNWSLVLSLRARRELTQVEHLGLLHDKHDKFLAIKRTSLLWQSVHT